MEIQKDGSVLISKFDEGISQTPLGNFSDMLGINIDDTPGTAFVGKKFTELQETRESINFTANASTDVITVQLGKEYKYRGNGDGLAFTVTTTGALPTGLAADTVYYTSEVGSLTFKVCTSLENVGDDTFVNITDAGTGTHTMHFITPTNIVDYTRGSSAYYFLDYDGDNNQRVWHAGSNPFRDQWLLMAGNTSAGDGQAIIAYKGYIIVFANSKADALTDITFPFLSSITWNNDFLGGAINPSLSGAKPYLSVNDDSVYFNNGAVSSRYYQIGLLEENAGETFDPSNGATFTKVDDVLTLPYESGGATALNEYGENLMIGTDSNKVYFWDKKSPSFTFFVELDSPNVKSIQIVDSMAYCVMENTGDIYQLNNVSSRLLARIPRHLYDYSKINNAGQNVVTVRDVTIFERELLMAVSFDLDVTNQLSNYIFSYNLDTGRITKRAISALGEDNNTQGSFGYISKIIPVGGTVRGLLISSSSYDTDESYEVFTVQGELYSTSINGTAYPYVYDNYEANMITGIFQLGEENNKQTYRKIRVSFLKKLTTSQGIKIYYRKGTAESWTLLQTVDYATYGAISEKEVDGLITDIVELQIKVEFKGYNPSSEIGNSPYLKYIKLTR